MGKRIQIFRVGKHTAMNGVAYDFTEAMLRDAVSAYDPALHEAPLVVGHPQTNDPAYGHAQSLHFADDGTTIEVQPCDVDPAFAELVNKGRFKKVSASWYLPTAPNNPKPGSLYLRHVGFLGAQPPAVKGLKSASFAEAEEGIVEFGDWPDVQNASLWRRLREWIISKDGMDEADKVIPDYAIQTLEQSARAESTPSINYAEPTHITGTSKMTPEQIAQKEADLLARETALQAQTASFSEREQRLTAAEKATQRTGFVSFADQLVGEGKLLPVHKDGVVAFMASLDAAHVVEFGEGDAKTSTPSLEWFKGFLTAQPKQVSFGEHKTARADADSGTASFAAPQGFSVDVESIELHNKALAHQKANPGVAYIDAYKLVAAN